MVYICYVTLWVFPCVTAAVMRCFNLYAMAIHKLWQSFCFPAVNVSLLASVRACVHMCVDDHKLKGC